jgi:hypothetical protein
VDRHFGGQGEARVRWIEQRAIVGIESAAALAQGLGHGVANGRPDFVVDLGAGEEAVAAGGQEIRGDDESTSSSRMGESSGRVSATSRPPFSHVPARAGQTAKPANRVAQAARQQAAEFAGGQAQRREGIVEGKGFVEPAVGERPGRQGRAHAAAVDHGHVAGASRAHQIRQQIAEGGFLLAVVGQGAQHLDVQGLVALALGRREGGRVQSTTASLARTGPPS